MVIAVDPLNMWIIYGLRYDLREWAKKHPGGSSCIEYSRGYDITALFLSYHSLSKQNVKKMIKPFLHPNQDNIPDCINNWEANPSEFYKVFTDRVGAYFDEQNFLFGHKATPGRLVLLTALTACWFALYASWYQGYWLSIVTLPVISWLAGSYLMHGGGHWSISSKPWVNKLGRILGSIHLAPHTWMMQHTVAHHQYTNSEANDPDLTHFQNLHPGFRLHANHPWKEGYKNWKTALSYEPSATIAGPGLILQLDYYFRGLIMETVPVKNMSWGDILLHALNRLIYVYLFGYLAFHLHGGYKGFVFMLVPSALHGLLFYAFSQITHINETSMGQLTGNWAIDQVQTAVDYCPRSWLLGFLSIGLNNQCVHHLLPQVDPVHYPNLTPILHQTCKEFGVRYTALDDWVLMMRKHIQYIKELNSPNSELVKSQQVLNKEE